jgi:hypothetical protein
MDEWNGSHKWHCVPWAKRKNYKDELLQHGYIDFKNEIEHQR